MCHLLYAEQSKKTADSNTYNSAESVYTSGDLVGDFPTIIDTNRFLFLMKSAERKETRK